MDPDGFSWYVAQTKTRAEGKASQLLGLKAIQTFLPRLLVHHRHGSRRWEALDPLFPGYLFARFSPRPDIIASVRWTPGVRSLLGDEDAPIPVPDEVVRYLQERVGDRGYIVPGQSFAPGMRVRFQRGPFVLLEGIIERPASRDHRVRVLLTLVRTAVTVEADIDDLEQT